MMTREYRDRYSAWSAEADRWNRLVRRIDRGKRLFLFSVIGYTIFDPTVGAVLIPAAAVLAGLVLVQNCVISRQERADRLVGYYDRLLDRFYGRWQGRGDAGTRFLTDAHVFADDLDVLGRGSLFELIAISGSELGRDTLALMLGGLLPYRPLVFWFVQLLPAIDSWRCRRADSAAKASAAIGRFETIAALASYAYEHPEDGFPEIVEEGPCFDSKRLRHPLLATAECVPNDVRLDGQLRLLLVSGSNMSGKSTLLRTVGLNSVLARTGAPVCAAECRVAPMLIGSSMRMHDSLAEGTSYFLAVIKRLRLVMDLLDQRRPVLFLLDEILQGTNSRDRRIGARAIVRKLIDSGAVGLITTHDLELTKLADELEGRARNVHFSDQVVDGRMSFDYEMKPGVVRSSNALPLMRSMGLDV